MLRGLVLFLALAQAETPPLSIRHEVIGEGRYRLRAELTGVSTVEAAQLLLLPEARRLCGSLPPVFGHHRWHAIERLEGAGSPAAPVSIVIEQDLACGVEAAPPAPPATAAVVDAAWRPAPADEERVRAATQAYFAARDAGRYAEAWAMFSPSNRAEMPLDRWSAEARAAGERAGAPGGLRLIRVTWYVNPASAPVPGVYAAVDYSADYANLHFMCGYLVWLLQEGGSWHLVREEQSVALRADMPDSTADDIARLRAQLCRD